MSTKKVLVLHSDGNELQSAFVRLERNRLIVESINIFTLPESLVQRDIEGIPSTAVGGETLTAEDIFGSDEKQLTNVLDETLEARPEAEGAEEQTNESILAAVFRNVPDKKYSYAINLPSHITHVIQVRNGFLKLKKSEVRKRIIKVVNERLNDQILSDHFDYFLSEDDTVFVFAYTGDIPLIDLYEGIQPELKVRRRITSILPDEISLANIECYNSIHAAEEIVIIVDIGFEESKIIVTKGGKIIQVADPIREDYHSPNLLKTIAGKILYEQNVGNLPDKFTLVLTGKAQKLDSREYFQKALGITEVDYFTAKTELFQCEAEIYDQISEYAALLGNAIAVLLPNSAKVVTLHLIPDYISRRQQVLKLTWHGYVILFLIFLSPIVINWQYGKNAKIQADFASKTTYLENSIKDLAWVEPLLDSLVNQTTINKQRLDLLEKLSAGTRKWGFILENLKQAIHDCGGHLWITDFSVYKDGFQMTGYSLYRNRPSRLAACFPEASVESVVPAEIRGERVYQFQLIVTKVTDDPNAFNPVVKIPHSKSVKKTSAGQQKTRKPAMIFAEAVELFNAKKPDQALDLFEAVLEVAKDPALIEKSRCWLGKCYTEVSDYQMAIEILENYIQDYPQSPEKLNGMLFLGKSYAAVNRKNEARQVFLEILKSSPTSEAGVEATQLISSLP